MEMAGNIKSGASGMDRILFYGVCALFFFLPVSISPLGIVEGLLLFTWIISGRFMKDAGLVLQKWGWPVLIMMVLPWIGLLYSGDKVTGFEFAKRTDYWLFSFIVAGVVISVSDAGAFFKAFIAGVTFTSLAFLGQLAGIVYRPGNDPYVFFNHGHLDVFRNTIQEPYGFLGNHSHIELSLLTTFSIMLLSFYFAESGKMRHKALCAGLMLVQFVSLALIRTDSGQAAFILLSPVIGYNLLGRKKLKLAFAISLMLVGALFLSPVVQGRIRQASGETAAYNNGQVATDFGLHYFMWRGAAKIFMAHPAIGTGTGGYSYFMNKDRQAGLPRFSQPQNTFLYMAASYGIFGILAIIYLWAVPLRVGWNKRRTVYGFAMLVFMAILTVGSITDTQVMSHQSGMLLAMFYGIVLAAGKKEPVTRQLNEYQQAA